MILTVKNVAFQLDVVAWASASLTAADKAVTLEAQSFRSCSRASWQVAKEDARVWLATASWSTVSLLRDS